MDHKDVYVPTTEMVLPLQVTGRGDIARLLRELAAVQDFLGQSAIRTPGTSVKLPKTSKLLDDMATDNKLNLLQEPDRKALKAYLKRMHEHAPSIHMSFSSDPSAAFTLKLITWLRKEINPHLLLQIGLQPTIAAGCILRTPNRQFDFSLRKHFGEHRELLIEKIGKL